MNISYKWLKSFIEFDYSPRELAAVFTSLGLECDTVEEVESIRGGLRGLVIGKVLTCDAHPNSDHLHLTTVDIGEAEPSRIVCGAPNVAAGQTVVVATLGTTLYDGDKEIKIKKSKIRGEESFGMICAADEIGLGEDHSGIMVLEGEVAPGTPAADYFGVSSDWMLEVELTPNRVDAASHYGCARDLRAYISSRHLDKGIAEIHLPDVSGFKTDRAEGGVQVEVLDAEGAPRYSGVTVRGVKVGESPQYLKDYLMSVGQRPINNIVDITNYILLGLGQPLHCFDIGKMKDEKVIVRSSEEGRKFVTLDGVERTLSGSDLMICDSERPMCIAGVFGGLESGVTDSTTDVFIESAWFNSTRIRKTARRHGLSTDASFRYERGTDPNITVYAAKLAALMIKELAGGEICAVSGGEAVVDIIADKKALEPAECSITKEYIDGLIGKSIDKAVIERILTSLDIEISGNPGGEMRLRIPRYRVDVTRRCDVVEEILRVYGYDNVSGKMSAGVDPDEVKPEYIDGKRCGTSMSMTDLNNKLRNTISEQLTAQGFNEIMNNSLSAESYYTGNETLPIEGCVRVMNPLSSDLGVMRRTLLYGGLESLAHNINRRSGDLKFYEFGNVYSRERGEESLGLYHEEQMLGLWLTGNVQTGSWDIKSREAGFFDLKGVVENIFRRLGVNPCSIVAEQGSDGQFSAKLTLSHRSGTVMAELGILRREELKRFEIGQSVVYGQVYWDRVFKYARKVEVTYEALPKTQAVKRDLSLLIDKGVSLDMIRTTVEKAEKKLLQDLTLFDVYEGKNLPEGKKSYAISLTLQDMDKTLTDKQIDSVMNKIINSLKQTLGAELR